jgi:uncharacterized protein DUF4411
VGTAARGRRHSRLNTAAQFVLANCRAVSSRSAGNSLDTSGLLDGWVRYYSPDVFQSLWKQMEAAAADGTTVAVQDVLLELERQDDDVFAWAKR